MIRAVFIVLGLYLVLCGAGLFMVDEITLTERVSYVRSPVLDLLTSWTEQGRRRVNPPDWMPFSCIGLGGISMLYAIALPRN